MLVGISTQRAWILSLLFSSSLLIFSLTPRPLIPSQPLEVVLD